MRPVEVVPAPATGLAEPLALLEESLRDGAPIPAAFSDRLQKAVEAGDIEVLVARAEDQILGVAVLAYHLNISAGDHFASIEDLYVRPEARRQGIGRTLLEEAHERCTRQNVSYVEVQVEGKEAKTFYTALGYEPESSVRVLSRSLPINDNQDLKPVT